ncbi:GAF domain-containing protein [Fodinicola acaciae]|uniref:sensor histidine kinase n=1 Tax=Fodinicola acaciae TaxID=2681555 RepID=UPI0013D8B0DD|nr:GAF domain-containing protein [Fodinicola acaciae]
MTDSPDNEEASGLTFPELPKMRLEELLEQLGDRARDVLKAQGRLRALIRANSLVAGELSLRSVLRHILTAARELVGANYAALGVIGQDGVLEEFLHVGMDQEVVDRIGDLPRGQGILGLLIRHPVPVRIPDLRDHPAAVGFPPHHPPMGSFLGVPIRIREKVFGNLYLTESAHGEFTLEDEQLVVALAGSAGVAIDNARLYQEVEQRGQWLAASTDVTRQLLTEGDEAPLELVLRYAAQGADADVASLILPEDTGEWIVRASSGVYADEVVGQVVDLDRTLAGRVIRSGKPAIVTDYQRDVHPAGAISVHTALAVPLLAEDDAVIGVITVARTPDRPPFTPAQLEQLAGFTGHVGMAMALARARADQDVLRTVEDHDRIAADLHDHVIQELFATGMGLQSLAPRIRDADVQSQVLGYVDSLDATIRRIRTTIFQLRSGKVGADGVRRRLLEVISEQSTALGFAPDTDLASFGGDLPDALADDIVAVVREALSNAARHAAASTVGVHVAADAATIVVEVIDNGRGIGDTSRLSGLSNLRQRAERHGGSLDIGSPPGGGTHLHWTARNRP